MKLIEILDNILLEMSYPRKKAENKIENLNHAIISHIACILLIKFDDSQKQYYNHWINEVNSYLFKIDEIRIKPKNKKLPFRRYFELLPIYQLALPQKLHCFEKLFQLKRPE